MDNKINNSLNSSDKSGMKKAIEDKINSKYLLLDITSSYKCFLKCKHCMFDCTPYDNRPELKQEKIFEYIDRALELNKFRQFAFGPQEIFFDIKNFIKIAKYLGQKVVNPILTTTTSCYWTKDYEYAIEQLSQLQEIGLKSILISVDDFHQEKINISKVINCIKASLVIGLGLSLQTIVSKNSRKKRDFINLIKNELQDYNIENLDWIEHNFTPVGRGSLIDKNEFLYEKEPYIGDCSILEILQITPEGEVKPCCGSGSPAKYLTLGNIENKNFSDIIKEAEINPFINSLFVWVGPQGLINILRNSGKTKLLSKMYTGTCHICHEIFSNEDVYQFLKEKLEEKKVELLAAKWYIEKKFKSTEIIN